MKYNFGFLKSVKVEVQDRNLHHIGVVVVTSESLLFKELPLRRFQRVTITDSTCPAGLRSVATKNVVIRSDQEACCAAGWVTDALP